MGIDYGPGIVAAYMARVGEAEQPLGSNRGPLMDACYEFVHDGAAPDGVVSDEEWCAAMYCYMAHLAGVPNGPKTASTSYLYYWCAGRGWVIYDPRLPVASDNNPADIEAGDAGLVLDATTATGFRHTRCVRIKPDPSSGVVYGVGGNEGDAVRLDERALSSMVYVRPFDAG